MRTVGQHLARAFVLERCRSLAQGTGGVDQVVHQHADAIADFTDDVHHLRLVRARTTFVDDGKSGVHAPGKGPRPLHAASVGTDDGDLLPCHPLPDVRQQHRHSEEVIYGDVEESLDLAGVEVHGEDSRRARSGNQVGH